MNSEQPVHTNAARSECLWVVEDLYTLLLSGEQTAGQFALFDMYVSPGKGSMPHVHSREDETFIITEGQVQFWVDGKTLLAKPGDVVHAPRNIPHYFTNAADLPARMHMMIHPAGLENFFREIGDPVTDRNSPIPQPDAEKIAKACEVYGMKLL